jgi:hypothetical protein
MNLTNVEMGLIFVEGSILVSLVITLLFVRKAMNLVYAKRARPFYYGQNTSPMDTGKLEALLKESAWISQDLSKNLEEKKEIIRKLSALLDGKIRNLHHLLGKTAPEENPFPPDSSGSDRHQLVSEMALSGCGVPDIARRLGFSKEEVQLILDLKKMTAN